MSDLTVIDVLPGEELGVQLLRPGAVLPDVAEVTAGFTVIIGGLGREAIGVCGDPEALIALAKRIEAAARAAACLDPAPVRIGEDDDSSIVHGHGNGAAFAGAW